MSSGEAHGSRRRKRRRSRTRREYSLGERAWQWLQGVLWPRTKTTRAARPATAKERWQAVSWVVALIAVFVVTLSIILNNTGDSNQAESPEAAPE
jgi:hypothetical protein